MKYRVMTEDALLCRMLKLELERIGFAEAASWERCGLLVLEGAQKLPDEPRLVGCVLIGCPMLQESLQEDIATLILERPVSLAELRSFALDVLNRPAEAAPDFEFDETELIVVRGDRYVKLTKREFALFSLLFARAGQVVTRTELLRTVWKDEVERDTNIVDVYVNFLRKKLEESFGERLIRSVRGRGYSFEEGSIRKSADERKDFQDV